MISDDDTLSSDESKALADILANPPPVPEFLRDVLPPRPTQAERAARFKAKLDAMPPEWREFIDAP